MLATVVTTGSLICTQQESTCHLIVALFNATHIYRYRYISIYIDIYLYLNIDISIYR